jgi:hypothetical protein
MSNEKHEFDQPDPLDNVGGTISGSSEFIPESTMIPESGLILPDESGHGNGPEVMEGEDGEGAIPESVATDSAELPGSKKGGGSDKASAIKKNLPFIVFGAVALGIVGVMGVKMMGGGEEAPQQQAAVQQPVQKPVQKPVEVVKPVEPVAAPVAVAAPAIDPTPVAPVAPVSVAPVAPVAPVAVATPPSDDMYSTKGIPMPPVKTTPTPTPVPVAAQPALGQCAPVKVEVPKCDAGADQPAVKTVKKSTGGMKYAKAKKKPEPLPSTEGFEVHMGANGLAWLTLPGGEQRVVTVGDRIEGLGVIKEIDADKHLIKVGRVTLR